MPYMKYDLPWMRYTVRSKEALDAIHAAQLAAVEEERAAAAAAAAMARTESLAVSVRKDIASGRCSLSPVEWQTLLIASRKPTAAH